MAEFDPNQEFDPNGYYSPEQIAMFVEQARNSTNRVGPKQRREANKRKTNTGAPNTLPQTLRQNKMAEFDPNKEHTPEALAMLFPELEEFSPDRHYTREELLALKNTPFHGRGLETLDKKETEKRLKDTPTWSEYGASGAAKMAKRGESGVGEHVWNNIKKRWEKIKSIPDYIDFAMKNPDTPAGQKIITEIAGWVAGGGFAAGSMAAKGAATAGSTTLGMNVGRKGAVHRSLTGDTHPIKQQGIAAKMEKGGMTREEIYDQTGWWKTGDKQWRFEISDDKMITQVGERVSTDGHPPGLSMQMDGRLMTGTNLKLPEVLSHPELFSTYPFLRNMEVRFTDDLPIHAADANSKTGIINIGTKAPEKMLSQKEIASGAYHTLSTKEYKDILAHEIQHLIQNKEGFSGGGSALAFMKAFKDTKGKLITQGEDSVSGFHKQSAIARLRVIQQLKEKGYTQEDMARSRVGSQELGNKYHVLHMPDGEKFVAKDLGITNAQLKQSGGMQAIGNVKARTWDEGTMARVVQGLKHETKDASEAMQSYLYIAGEVEARQVGDDVALNMAQRRSMYPWERSQTSSKHDEFYGNPHNRKIPEDKQIHFEKDFEGKRYSVEKPRSELVDYLNKLKYGGSGRGTPST